MGRARPLADPRHTAGGRMNPERSVNGFRRNPKPYSIQQTPRGSVVVCEAHIVTDELKPINGTYGETLDAAIFADTHSLYVEVRDEQAYASICFDYRTARKFAKAILKAQDKLK